MENGVTKSTTEHLELEATCQFSQPVMGGDDLHCITQQIPVSLPQ